MSRLTIFSLCTIVVVVVAFFVWDYSHTKNQLVQAHADLAASEVIVEQQKTALASQRNAIDSLRVQANASQQNCTRALMASSQLFELALPPHNLDLPPSLLTETDAGSGAEGIPSFPSAPPRPVNIQSAGANDATFTTFLNTW